MMPLPNLLDWKYSGDHISTVISGTTNDSIHLRMTMAWPLANDASAKPDVDEDPAQLKAHVEVGGFGHPGRE